MNKICKYIPSNKKIINLSYFKPLILVPGRHFPFKLTYIQTESDILNKNEIQ